MPLVPITPKPGLYKNGTNYSAKGRWREANLIRWVDGFVRVIGGWERRSDDAGHPIAPIMQPSDYAGEAPRSSMAWADNSGGRYLAIGTTTRLFTMTASGAVNDVTPDDFTPGLRDSGLIRGFGIGPFGVGRYGRQFQGASAQTAPVGTWSFDVWGEDLMAAGPLGAYTRLFYWTPDTPKAMPVPNAPTDFHDFVVTSERMVMVVGHGPDGRGVIWCDEEDREQWTPAATNTAGSITLSGQGKLICAKQVAGSVLILGEQDAYRARYIRAPFVYGFDNVGLDCGCYNAASVVVAHDFAIWPGKNTFWRYDGALQKVPCDVQDFFERDMRYSERSKMFGWHNSEFNEIWWHYQSNASDDEIDRYIAYNYITGEWMEGQLQRNTAVNQGIFRSAIMVDRTGTIWNHEISDAAIEGTARPYVKSGPIEIANGDNIAYADYIIPDEFVPGDVELYLHARDMPNGPQRSSGPYKIRNPIPVRVRGRELEFEIRGLAKPDWMTGMMRLNIKAGGKR